MGGEGFETCRKWEMEEGEGIDGAKKSERQRWGEEE